MTRFVALMLMMSLLASLPSAAPLPKSEKVKKQRSYTPLQDWQKKLGGGEWRAMFEFKAEEHRITGRKIDGKTDVVNGAIRIVPVVSHDDQMAALTKAHPSTFQYVEGEC
jgi:hypothetical protein